MNSKIIPNNLFSFSIVVGVVFILSYGVAIPTFSQYANFRPEARLKAVPKPIPGFRAADYPPLAGVKIMETRDLTELHPSRGLVLWVKNAQKSEMAEYVSCPDSVNGSNYSGEIHASLLDVKTKQVLQTLYFDTTDLEGSSLPFRITPGLYSVQGKANALGEKKTVLLDPVQVDLDTTCEEYAFYENPGGCFCPDVFPFGYDSKADTLFQFKEISYDLEEEGVKKYEAEFMGELFFEIIKAPGRKKYIYSSSIGHGSDVFTLHRFEYNRKLRTFYGVNADVPDDDEHNALYFDKSGKLNTAARRYLDKTWKDVNPQPNSEEKKTGN